MVQNRTQWLPRTTEIVPEHVEDSSCAVLRAYWVDSNCAVAELADAGLFFAAAAAPLAVHTPEERTVVAAVAAVSVVLVASTERTLEARVPACCNRPTCTQEDSKTPFRSSGS